MASVTEYEFVDLDMQPVDVTPAQREKLSKLADLYQLMHRVVVFQVFGADDSVFLRTPDGLTPEVRASGKVIDHLDASLS